MKADQYTKPETGPAMPVPEQRHVLNLTYAYTLTSLSYYVLFGPVFAFYAHKLYLGLAHGLFAVLVAALFVHMRLTKSVKLASYGVCTLAASMVLVMALEGGIGRTGIYFVLPVAILLFFLPSRRYSLAWIGAMLAVFLGALALSVFGYVQLPYSNVDFLLFISSFFSSVVLLIIYAQEKDKLDRKLNQSLKEIRLLAHSLEQEKARVEEKVQERTQQYREEHAKLEASIDSLRIGFIILDQGLAVLSINDAAKRILLATTGKEQVRAAPATMTMSEIVSHLGGGFDLVTKTRSCLQHKRPVMARDVKFGSRYLAFTITPVIDGKVAVGAVVLLEDTTDSKALERSRDEFFSIASHELRTPLTSIVGNASMVQQYYGQLEEPELKGMLSDINSSGKRLIAIVNDFLDVSRLEQGKLVMKIMPLDVAALMQEVIRDMAKLAESRGLALRLAGTTRLPAMVLADPDRLRQVLVNLVSNAIKYTDQGSVTVAISVDSRTTTVTVKDTGKGIPVESQYLLFRKFQQASHNTLTRDNSQSTGLGLYISKMLAKAMKGDVYLKSSEPGKGSEFAMAIPTAVK